MKKMRHIIEFVLLMLFNCFVLVLPFRTALWFGRQLGDIAFYILRIRRNIVMRNLTLAFPDKSFNELLRIARKTYRNLAMSMIEVLSFPKLNDKSFEENFDFEGSEYLDDFLKRKKGAVLVSGHFGSWELLGAAVCKKGYPMDVLVLNQHNRFVDTVLNSYRKSKGVGIIQLKFALKWGLKSIKRGRFLAALVDQDAGRRDGIFVDFFGRPASTSQGPAVFALRTDVPIAMAFCIRQPSYVKHKAKFIPVDFKKTGNYGKDVELLTLRYTQILEDFIRKYPDQWFWFHKRWKTVVDNMEKMY
ncbi:MAG: lysophospholipid acyltransferase family protein [Elusimicrobia bacterium]|nr:lysophospholipid acyltransferase family protein [Elusimicrobiota bacterium]